MPRLYLVGVGNRLRGDDGVGPAVIDAVRDRAGDSALRDCELSTTDGEIAGLVDTLARAPQVVIIDAVHARGAYRPGQLLRFDGDLEGLELATSFSSHGLGIVEAIRLAAALGQAPRRLTVYGIVGANFADGPGLSPVVDSTAAGLCATLCESLGGVGATAGFARH